MARRKKHTKTKHKKEKRKKQPKKRQKKQKSTKIPKKELFNYESVFSFFGGCPKFPFFDNLAKKNAHPKNTIKIGVSATHFLENNFASRNGHFWTKSRIQKFQLSFLGLFLLFQQQETPKLAETPIFIAF